MAIVKWWWKMLHSIGRRGIPWVRSNIFATVFDIFVGFCLFWHFA